VPQLGDDEDVFYSDFDRTSGFELRSADAGTDDGRRRHELIVDVLARYRALPEGAAAGFAYPEQRRDWRAGSRIALSVATSALATEHQRYTPAAIELERAHLTTGGLALAEGIHALSVADLMNTEDFAFLTGPLSQLLGIDLTQQHPELRADTAPAPGPLVPYNAPRVDPLPAHPLWRHTRQAPEQRLRAIHGRDGGDVYVVDLHLDVGWYDLDIRDAGIEIRWNTHSRLAERRRAWRPHPALPADPHALDDLAWDWFDFLGGDESQALWKRDSDPAGHALLADYATQLGLWYTDAELAADEDDELLDSQGELEQYLKAGLPVAIRVLHDDGF
jgi:hypothetical protein